MLRIAIACLAIALAAPASAAPPNVPTSLPYQGLLLDGLGEPRTGSVDLTVRIHDALIGGVLVYKQSFPNVPLSDGVFTVQLGPNGEGTDAPSNPLTTSLSTALAGDAGATAPVRFLEVTVGGDGALARTQILSSAYAVRASSAASADIATTAATATEATNVSGVSGLFVSAFFEQFNADGGGPPNFDPTEGVVDTDGDGVLNFVDADNDGDDLSDIAEVGQGSNVNLVTPVVATVTPASAQFTSTVGVTVTGANFQPPLSVVFGTQTPTPTNVTGTSFDVTVGPQPPGPASIQVTNGNGETDLLADVFTWLSTVAHSVALNPGSGLQSSIDARTGTNFVVFSGQKQYGIGPLNSGLGIWSFASRGAGGQIATAFEPSGRLNGIRCLASGTNCSVEVRADADGDSNLEDEATAIPIETVIGSNALLNSATLRFDPSGHRVAGYQRSDGTSSTALVAHDHNGDGDFGDANELLTVGTTASVAAIPSGLAVDAAGRVAYVRGAGGVLAAWDRNGDGDFADTVGANPELSTVVSSISPSCLGATFDSADRLAIVYGASGVVTLLRDLDADGDFGDAGESTVLISVDGTHCDVDWRAGQPFTVAHRSGTSIAVKMDENDDGDFSDPGETSSFAANPSTALRLRMNGTNAAFIGFAGFISTAPTN